MTNWSGYGILAPIIILTNALMANLITDYVTKDDNYYSKNLIPMGISLLCSALTIKLVSDYFNRKKAENKGTWVFDKVTIAEADSNKLYLIPFRYWAFITGGLGIILISVQLFVRR